MNTHTKNWQLSSGTWVSVNLQAFHFQTVTSCLFKSDLLRFRHLHIAIQRVVYEDG